MQLILVRHPRPLVATGVCYGSTDLDVAAEQIDTVANALAAELAGPLSAGAPVYSSPLRRCASLAAKVAGPAVIHDPRLVEMHFGAWEMQPWDDIPRAAIDSWAADMTRYRPGGGESVLQMAARVAAFHADMRRLALRQPVAIVICHAGTMRLLAACHAGLTLEEMALQAAAAPHQIGYGQCLILQS